MAPCRTKYQQHEGQPRAFLWELQLKIALWVGLEDWQARVLGGRVGAITVR